MTHVCLTSPKGDDFVFSYGSISRASLGVDLRHRPGYFSQVFF